MPVDPGVRAMRIAGSRARTLVVLIVAGALVLAGGITFLVVRSSGSSGGSHPGTTAEPGGVRYVAPSPAGAGDGSSWADAAALSDVPSLVGQLSGGGEIWLRADAGPYQVTGSLQIASGGTDGSPVVIRGVDANGQPAPAVLQGDRTSPYDPKGNGGGDVFFMRGGTAHLAFQQLAFQNVGNAFLAVGDVKDVVISDTTATNVRRFFENAKSAKEPSANVSDLVIRNVTITGFSKRAVRLRYASHDVLLEDVVGDSQQQDGDDFAIGVHLEDQVHGVVLRRVTMENTKDTLHSYWNGDGFATERGVSDITFEDTTSSGNTDAGYDLKSTKTVLQNAVSSGNKRNFRLWADDVVVRDCQGIDPLKRGGEASQAQVWLGKDAKARLEGCSLSDQNPQTVVFVLEPGAQLTMTGGKIEHAGDLESVQGGADVRLTDVVQ